MSRDRIFTLLSRKLAGETTPPELEELAELLAANPDQQRSMDLADEYWNTAPEQDKDFLEATYHLHLNRLKDLGHDLTETATNEINNNWKCQYISCGETHMAMIDLDYNLFVMGGSFQFAV